MDSSDKLRVGSMHDCVVFVDDVPVAVKFIQLKGNRKPLVFTADVEFMQSRASIDVN